MTLRTAVIVRHMAFGPMTGFVVTACTRSVRRAVILLLPVAAPRVVKGIIRV